MDNEYMNLYMKDRWEKRRARAVDYLGGACAVCGTSDTLEFDHVDPSTKVMTIARASSRSEAFFWTEVDKCQLLCKEHHIEKTQREFGKAEHGTLSIRGCKCVPCKEAKSQYNRDYRTKQLQMGIP